MSKLVSVIIPTYSRPTNIIRAIESVERQTYKSIEIIVVDDNGIDSKYQKETYDILKPYIESKKIRYVTHDVNRNGSAARNTGAKCAEGTYLSFLDDDDEFYPEKIECQVNHLENAKDPLLAGVICNGIIFGSTRKFPRQYNINGHMTGELLSGKLRFNSSSILIRKEIFEELNGFDESFRRHQDWEFSVRLFRKYKLATACPERFLFVKHQTPNILSSNPLKAIEYKEYFLNKFKKDIDSLPNKNDIYQYQYKLLGFSLLKNHHLKIGCSYLKKSFKYKSFSIKDWLKALFYFFQIDFFLRISKRIFK